VVEIGFNPEPASLIHFMLSAKKNHETLSLAIFFEAAGQVFDFNWSQDRKQLPLTRRETTSDVDVAGRHELPTNPRFAHHESCAALRLLHPSRTHRKRGWTPTLGTLSTTRQRFPKCATQSSAERSSTRRSEILRGSEIHLSEAGSFVGSCRLFRTDNGQAGSWPSRIPDRY
jgi:hypothetical protein